MSEKPISPLRRRMIEDMMVRNFVEKTRNDYIRQVRTFTAFLGRSPDTATAEELRRFQLHQSQSGVRPPSMNNAVAALRFFFHHYSRSTRDGAAPHLRARAAQNSGGLESRRSRKGRKDRFGMLSAKLLELLRDWYRIATSWRAIDRRSRTSRRESKSARWRSSASI